MKTLALSLLIAASPATAQSLPASLVWLPPDNFMDWHEVDALLRARSELKLTVALTPEMASAPARAALDPWAAKGRVEIAARITGDPILPWIASHPAAARPQDALERGVEARESHKKLFGAAPLGLVVGAGALDGALASALGATGASWILTGPYASDDAPWAASGKALLVPAHALFDSSSDAWTAPGAGVYDESASTSSVFLTVLSSMNGRGRPALGWALVGDLLRAKAEPRREAAEVDLWPSWDLTAAQTPSAPEARAAWDAYGAAAAAVNRYQNSGAADLKTLDAAVELLRKAQASRHYRSVPEGTFPPDLRAQLLALYKKLKLPAPEALYGPGEGGSSPAAGDGPTGIKASAGPSWIEFRSPAGVLAMAPMGASTAAARVGVDGGGAADPWRVQSLRADWDESAVRLTLRAARFLAGPPRPVYEIYVDFNHVLGAGRIPLLEGRGAIVPARDAWELALSIVGEEARLYRARGGGDPEETSVFKASWDPVQGAVTVAIPRAFMRGNPSRWGWAAVAFAEDPARAGRRPCAPLIAPDGAILLGVLAPKDIQKAVLTRANSRVPAARLEP